MSENYDRVDAGKLTAFAAEALEKLGVPADDAMITARMLVACDLRAVESHGVAHLRMFYASGIRSGFINVDPSTTITNQASSTAVMDGDRGLGFVVGYRAMNEAMRRATETGAGFVAVRNSTHFGAAAYYAMMALEHDMIGIAMTSSLPGVAAPGSAVPAVGTNPLAVAVPAGDRPPFVLDMATSTVAGGKLEIARRKEATEIPSGWLVDREGNPVTDLRGRTGSSGGMLAPLGGVPETGAYKGFGLALVVEILSALLSGSVGGLLQRTAPEALGNYDGHWFGAFRIDGFLPVADFKKAMDGMLNALEALPTVPGVERVTIPGLYEAPIVEEALARGIPLHPKVINDLKLLAEELGIGYDL